MMRVLIAFVLVLSLVSIVDARGRRGGSNSGSSNSVSQAELLENYQGPTHEVEVALLERINAERTRFGLRALILDPIIHLRARRHCVWMARNHSMIHSNDGAENIAMGYSNVDAAVNGWMNSSGHRANILNPGYTRTGIAGYTSSSGSVYWCQQFN